MSRFNCDGIAATHRVFKYEVNVGDEQVLELPEGAKFLKVASLNDHLASPIHLWFEVCQNADPKPFMLYIRGTGHHLGDASLFPYLGSVIVGPDNHPLVWHAYGGFVA